MLRNKASGPEIGLPHATTLEIDSVQSPVHAKTTLGQVRFVPPSPIPSTPPPPSRLQATKIEHFLFVCIVPALRENTFLDRAQLKLELRHVQCPEDLRTPDHDSDVYVR